MSNRLLAVLLRVSAAVLIVGGLLAWFVDLPNASLILVTACAVGLSVVLVGVASVLARPDDGPVDLSRQFSRVQQQVHDMQRKVDDMAVAMDRMARNRSPLSETPAPPTPVVAQLPARALEPIARMFEELRGISLLTDDERRQRLLHMEQERKLVLVRDVLAKIESRRWAEADQVLATLEAEHPNDLEVKRTRLQFEDARRNAEAATVERVRHQLDSLISGGAFEQAEQMAKQLTVDFPGNVEGRSLLSRVIRERDIHRETTVARMVEEIRHDIDRRLWRRALMHSQKLLEKFPDHPKTQKVREQMNTLHDNAEIEERQEQEVRIQELIRSRKFNEAIQLAEDLLARFPNSPQAEAIETLLPRIRDLAKEEEQSPAA